MRLTYKLEKPINTKYLHYDYMIIADYDISRGNYGRITDSEIYNKLGQLEDIEDSLGCSIDTFVTTMRHKCVWIKLDDKIDLYDIELSYTCDCSGEWLSNFKDILVIPKLKTFVYLKDYGKTWALKKEELQ